MQYDVFISYSRQDMVIANQLCQALDRAGISYWIDRNIHGSANFLAEITRYIRDCKVVVFVASSHSAASAWTQREILFSLKRNKHIIPYRIGDFRFEDNDELDFVFTNMQWIESEQAVITALHELGCDNHNRKEKEAELTRLKSELIELKKKEQEARAALKRAESDCELKEKEIAKIEAELNGSATTMISVPKPTSMPTPASPMKYKVGDYYEKDGIRGVVFEVSEDGLHGKVVSVDTSLTMWCTSEQYSKGIVVGASAAVDGKYNTDRVMQRTDNSRYQAFVWCRSKAVAWYLPSKEELVIISRNKDKINATLVAHRHAVIDGCYWSSTEFNNNCSWYVDMNDGFTRSYFKNLSNHVRAVAIF